MQSCVVIILFMKVSSADNDSWQLVKYTTRKAACPVQGLSTITACAALQCWIPSFTSRLMNTNERSQQSIPVLGDGVVELPVVTGDDVDGAGAAATGLA